MCNYRCKGLYCPNCDGDNCRCVEPVASGEVGARSCRCDSMRAARLPYPGLFVCPCMEDLGLTRVCACVHVASVVWRRHQQATGLLAYGMPLWSHPRLACWHAFSCLLHDTHTCSISCCALPCADPPLLRQENACSTAFYASTATTAIASAPKAMRHKATNLPCPRWPLKTSVCM